MFKLTNYFATKSTPRREPIPSRDGGATELEAIDNPWAAAKLIRDRRIPREHVPADLLELPEVWEALLATMPMTAMIRNLATMTRVGLLAPGSAAVKRVIEQLHDRYRLRQARLHPIAVLAALLAYKAGRGVRGSRTWQPVASIVDALDAAFYASFSVIEPAGKRMLLALDVSGSMASGMIGGVPGLTPRIASAAMALVTAATERDPALVAFTAASHGSGGITTLSISPRQRLDDAVAEVSRYPMGGIDCALPMRWAQEHRVDVDTFCIYTDNKTWAGDVHPAQALRSYRDARGIPAKLVVVGMTSTGFSIADPNDAGMIDVVGFDTSTPPVIADFARA
jgi:60 kDa SS-A/Ro ribonucleoprotein